MIKTNYLSSTCLSLLTLLAANTLFKRNLSILSTLALLILLFISSSAFAEEEKERGYKGPITKEALLFELQKIQSKNNAYFVEGYIIKGDDIISIIKETDLEIQIKKSIITGGLDFRKLPKVPLGEVKLPESWSEKKKKDCRERLQSQYNKFFFQVTNQIYINDSEIEKDTKLSVRAGYTIFSKIASFSRSTFNGEFYQSYFVGRANFSQTTFAEETSFKGSTFGGKADFSEAIFIGNASFGRSSTDYVYFTLNADFSGATFSGDTFFPRCTFNREADFSNATFGGKGNFSGSTFSGKADFSDVTFSGDIAFSSTKFNSGGVFSKAEFKGTGGFSNSIFTRSAKFNSVIFNKKANFTNSIFSGAKVNFGHSSFINGKASLSINHIRGEVDYSNTTFSQGASFLRAIFISDKTNFQFATFSQAANFSEAIFVCDKISFSYTTFSHQASFKSTTFLCDIISFSDVTFSKSVSFTDANFPSSEISFSRSIFSGNTYFSRTIFHGDTFFTRSHFMKLAKFNRSQFKKKLDISSSNFEEYIDFRDTKIGRLNFDSRQNPTVIKAHFDFRGASIGESHFQDIIFEKDVYFSDTRFGVHFGEENADGNKVKSPRSTIFRFVTFEGQSDFRRTIFMINTAFENVTFMNNADFTDADFKQRKKGQNFKFSLSYLNFNNLRAKWGQLPNIEFWVSGSQERIQGFSDVELERKLRKEKKRDKSTEQIIIDNFLNEKEKKKLEEERKKDEKNINKQQESIEVKKLESLSSVLKNLEVNFRSNKQLYDANQAYFHRKRAEIHEVREGDDDWLTKQREAEWYFWGIICGYGTRIWWIVGWSFFSTVLFAAIYCLKGELNRQPQPDTSNESNFRQRLLDFPKDYYSGERNVEMNLSTRKFVNALRFSSVILLKFGYRDTTISGNILGIDYKYIVWVEWLLGYYILAALAVTISNTLPVVNRLISGVF